MAEGARLEDAVDGTRADVLGRVSAGVPGVVRELLVHRSGEGLVADRPDRYLAWIGLRLAGDSRFIQEVRAR